MQWATLLHKSAISAYTCICESSSPQCFDTQRQNSTLAQTFSHRNFSMMLTDPVSCNFWSNASNATLVMFEPVHALAIGRTLGSDHPDTRNVLLCLHCPCYCALMLKFRYVPSTDGTVIQD
jgi:hypothetical protein